MIRGRSHDDRVTLGIRAETPRCCPVRHSGAAPSISPRSSRTPGAARCCTGRVLRTDHQGAHLSDPLEASGCVYSRLAISVRYGPLLCPLLGRHIGSLLDDEYLTAVLAERRLGVAGVARSLALAAAGGLPLAALDGLEQVLLVGILQDRRDSSSRYRSWPSDSG